MLTILWRRPALLGSVVLADAIGVVGSFALRNAIDRDRPPVDYPHPKALVHVPHDGSLPSGHTTAAFACATMLAFWLPRYAAPLYLLAAAIGFSRIYVGVHYPLDVVAGAALGTAIAIALRWLVANPPRLRRAQQAG